MPGTSPARIRSASALMVVHATRQPTRAGLPARVGFVVSKAVGNAVVRNATKRRLRHAVGQRLSRIAPGTDLVVRANPAAAHATSAELGAELDAGLDRIARRLPALPADTVPVPAREESHAAH